MVAANLHGFADRFVGVQGEDSGTFKDVPAPIAVLDQLMAAQSDLDAMVDNLQRAFDRIQNL